MEVVYAVFPIVFFFEAYSFYESDFNKINYLLIAKLLNKCYWYNKFRKSFACQMQCWQVTCWKRADFLALLSCVCLCFCHFPICVLIHIRTKGTVGIVKHV